MKRRLLEIEKWARGFESESGQALVEFTLCLSLLLILSLGLIDFSMMIFDKQQMSGLTRQGSDLASRGTALTTTVSALGTQGASLNIGAQGRIIVTAVANVNNKAQVIEQSESSTGITVTSAIGTGVGSAATMPSSASTILNAGQTIYVTEIFYSYKPITPVGNFLKTSLASTMYENGYF